MSINFQQFLEITGFTAAYAARKILYFPKSRPALLATNLDLDVKAQRSEMVGYVNGSKKKKQNIKTDSNLGFKSKSSEGQLDIIKDNPSAISTNDSTEGHAA